MHNNQYNINLGGIIFPVFKNPTDDQYSELVEHFKSKYPNLNISGEPKTRQTYDREGNIFIWVSADAMHYIVESFLLKRGIECNQNKYFENTA